MRIIKHYARYRFHGWIFLLVIFFSSCCTSRYYIDIRRQKINSTYLASSGVGSPDPRQKCPPLGDMLIIDWQIPRDMVAEKASLRLYVIYWDNEEKVYTWPLEKWKGYRTFSVLNKEFVRTGGILTYRAEIIDQNDCVFREWTHQLWVNLIKL